MKSCKQKQRMTTIPIMTASSKGSLKMSSSNATYTRKIKTKEEKTPTTAKIMAKITRGKI